MKKINPIISKHFSELGKRGAKASWEVRKAKILGQTQKVGTNQNKK